MNTPHLSSTVYIVDDDEAVRDSLRWLLEANGYRVRAFASAESFLDEYDAAQVGVLIADVRMPGMSGLELQEQLIARNAPLPIVFITGHGDVPKAVSALKKGARDFVEKPFNDNDLVDRVIEALAFDAAQREREAGQAGVAARLATLTQRERQVMELVVAGKLNKVIADDLGISMRTVEVHRAHVFEKMGVKTAVELARLLAAVA